MKASLAPQKIITLSALFLLACIILASYLATRAPWLGLTLVSSPDGSAVLVQAVDEHSPAAGMIMPGERLAGIGPGALPVAAADIIEEPDALSLYRDYNAFFERQAVLHEALSLSEVVLSLGDGRELSVRPLAHRPLAELPWLFWYQIACGGIVFLAGMSVLAFRPRETVTLYYALTGFGLLLAAGAAAIYSTRELALDGALFYGLSLTNQFGTLLFSGPFISILWYYPQRVHRFPLGPVIIGYYMLSWLLNYFQVFDSLDVGMRLPVFVGLVINLSLAIIQWRLSRSEPVQRAILKWFLLAWLSGTTFYVGLHTIPLMLGMETVISQSLGWGILFTVYLGIAFGITRYRLFNLDRWVLTGWYWFLGGLSIIAIDALLVSALDLNNQMALAITLAAAGWLYFPLRQMLWKRFAWYNRRNTNYQRLLPALLTTVLNTRAEELPQEWLQLLKRTFSPLHIEPVASAPAQAQIVADGSALILPAFHHIEGLKLTYAQRGGRLFNDEDRSLADAMQQLFSRVQGFRQAFHDGTQQERRRVARDLHDDVGAKLLTLVYSADNETQAGLARETLQELRDVIRNLEQTHYTLVSTLDELQRETVRRCEAHKVSLKWNQQHVLHDHTLDPRQHSNLQRIVREAVSNALRHSAADTLQVDIAQDADNLILKVSNNNVSFDAEKPHKPGRGMRNIQSRAGELGGEAQWQTGEAAVLGGYTVTIEIPMGAGDE